jgi:hypothetical protein
VLVPGGFLIFDAHIHIQPWEMVNPDVLSMIDDPSHQGAKEVLSSPENVLRYLDAEGVDRACCINYVSPDVIGFTREVNDWIATLHPRSSRSPAASGLGQPVARDGRARRDPPGA